MDPNDPMKGQKPLKNRRYPINGIRDIAGTRYDISLVCGARMYQAIEITFEEDYDI
jgi:hypothetical protein